MMTILLIVAFYILEHDNFIYELATYLEFLGAFIASLALILTVSYRISLSKSKKTAD